MEKKGILQPIVNVFMYILNFIHSIVGNYGVAIIIMTFLVRALLLPLTLKQEKSMKRQKELEPKIAKLKEKYKDDKQQLNIKIAELYKQENVNPAAGCLPLLIQLPIFIALYRTFLYNSVQGTFLWFDLSKPDALFTVSGFTFNLLPVLTAILTLLQQKMMQGSINNSGNKDSIASSMNTMLYFMPIMMLLIFYRMPSGLNLYYFVNTVLSILQQYYVLSRRDS